MKKANLFIIGASKCGTTSFYNILKEHPDICMSSIKETSYFSLSEEKQKNINYQDYYNHCNDQSILGEVSPIYSELHSAPKTAERIYDYNPDAKIIYLVRNPINRLKSVWKQTLHTGHWKRKVYLDRFGIDIPKMSLAFEEAVFEYPPFLDACRYWFQIDGYRKFFSDQQIKVLLFEEFVNEPEKVFKDVFSFLEIENFDISKLEKQHNKSSGKKMMNPKLQSIIESNFVQKIKDIKLLNNFKTLCKEIVYKEVPDDIKINNKLKNEILNELEDDIERILDYAGKNSNYWSFE